MPSLDARGLSPLHYRRPAHGANPPRFCARAEGLCDDVVFCFDLELPPDFRPENRDGEVEEFYLWPLERVREVISESCDFKFNCALVIIDFLARHEFLKPQEHDYAAITRGLIPPAVD